MKDFVKRFVEEEDGIGVVEIILILVVLIGLVMIFRTNLKQIVNNIFDSILRDVGTVNNN